MWIGGAIAAGLGESSGVPPLGDLAQSLAIALTAALAPSVGECTAPEHTDLLMQDAAEQFDGDLNAEARRQLLDPEKYPPEEVARRERHLEQTIADLRAPLHENCYLSPTQFAEKFGLPAAAPLSGDRSATAGAAGAAAARETGDLGTEKAGREKADAGSGGIGEGANAAPAPASSASAASFVVILLAAAAVAAALAVSVVAGRAVFGGW